jgi:hypothetical protein
MIALLAALAFVIGAVKLDDWHAPLMWGLIGLTLLAIHACLGGPLDPRKRG